MQRIWKCFLRRFTRLALGFNKQLENLKSTVALFFTYYNFWWIPRTTRITPAMGINIDASPWTIKELLENTIYNCMQKYRSSLDKRNIFTYYYFGHMIYK